METTYTRNDWAVSTATVLAMMQDEDLPQSLIDLREQFYANEPHLAEVRPHEGYVLETLRPGWRQAVEA